MSKDLPISDQDHDSTHEELLKKIEKENDKARKADQRQNSKREQ